MAVSASGRRDWAPGLPVFLLGVSGIIVGLAFACWRTAERGRPIRTAGRWIVLAMLAGVPALFLQRLAPDAFERPKFLVLFPFGVLAGLVWATGDGKGQGARFWRNGLHWPVLALLAQGALSMALSGNGGLSRTGEFASYDGMYSAAALALVFFAVAGTFRLCDVKVALVVLYFAAGGLAVLYGLVQLHDRFWPTATSWDWAKDVYDAPFWVQPPEGRAVSDPFVEMSPWSTMGNPNHLAGLLAVFLPAGTVLWHVLSQRWLRTCIAATALGALAVMLGTTSRGG